MGHGVTEKLNAFARQMGYRRVEPYDTPRDRSLRGKARIKARKAANKASRA